MVELAVPVVPSSEAKIKSPSPSNPEVKLDLEAISASGLLVPNATRSQLADEFRVIKRPLIANAMGQPGKDAGDVLEAFIRGLGMPCSLQDVRIGPEHFDRIAEQAMGTPWIPRNPRKIDSPAQVREILLLAA